MPELPVLSSVPRYSTLVDSSHQSIMSAPNNKLFVGGSFSFPLSLLIVSGQLMVNNGRQAFRGPWTRNP